MPRYVIERNFGTISDEDMLAASALSDELISARFPEIAWEHSHIVATDDGEIVTFCIYGAPSEEIVETTTTSLYVASELTCQLGYGPDLATLRHHPVKSQVHRCFISGSISRPKTSTVSTSGHPEMMNSVTPIRSYSRNASANSRGVPTSVVHTGP